MAKKLELRFYNGRQLSDHEISMIDKYLEWYATTELAKTQPLPLKSRVKKKPGEVKVIE